MYVFSVLGYSLKIYLCQDFPVLPCSFLVVFWGFFFAVQAWGDCYNLCLVDGQLEKYLELDTLCPG